MKLTAELTKEQEEDIEKYLDEWTRLVALYEQAGKKYWLQNQDGEWHLCDSEWLASWSMLAIHEKPKSEEYESRKSIGGELK